MSDQIEKVENNPKCPKCNNIGQVHIHQCEGFFNGTPVYIVDIGWRCGKCGCEWGFEHPEMKIRRNNKNG